MRQPRESFSLFILVVAFLPHIYDGGCCGIDERPQKTSKITKKNQVRRAEVPVDFWHIFRGKKSAIYGKSKVITATGPNADWRSKREIAGGGILLDQGIHMVDLLRLFAGDFDKVHSFISNKYWKYDVEDNAYALMKTPNNIVALLHSSATLWRHNFNLHITCELGSLELSGILSSTKSYGAESLTVAYKSDNELGDPKEITTRYNTDPSWDEEISEFCEAILNKAPITSGSSEDALKTMELVYKIYSSDKEWKDKWDIKTH